MANFDNYTDEELGRMLKQASKDMTYKEREDISTLDAFCEWLHFVGLSPIANGIKLAQYAWQKIRSIWSAIFG
jgi:hypothetical protein